MDKPSTEVAQGSGEIVPSVTPEPASDSGLLADPHHAAQDAKLVARALRNRWPIPEHMRPKIVDRLVGIATDSPDDGDAIKAASVLRTMDGDNMTMELEEAKNARLDEGKATQAVQLYGRRAPIEEV
jgi:hypothetical protein